MTLTGCTSTTATPEPLGPVLPLLEGLHSLISAASVLPSAPALCLVLSASRAAGLLSSAQLPAREPCGEGETRARAAWAELPWQEMLSAGVVPVHDTLASLSLQSPLHQQAHGHPLWCGWAGERCCWFVHLGELLAN